MMIEIVFIEEWVWGMTFSFEYIEFMPRDRILEFDTSKTEAASLVLSF